MKPSSPIPPRLLLGPGPGNLHARVLEAMSQPLLGHLDPEFLAILEDVKASLRGLLQTGNELTLPISATGSAGMEACLVNLLEPGDEIVVGVNGVFGGRMCEVASRCRRPGDPGRGRVGRAALVPTPWGRQSGACDRAWSPSFMRRRRRGSCRAFPSRSLGLHERPGALVVLDCVTSLAGLPIELDTLGCRRRL